MVCLGEGAANARVIKEARARNLDIIVRDANECGLGLKVKEKRAGGGETAEGRVRTFYIRDLVAETHWVLG